LSLQSKDGLCRELDNAVKVGQARCEELGSALESEQRRCLGIENALKVELAAEQTANSDLKIALQSEQLRCGDLERALQAFEARVDELKSAHLSEQAEWSMRCRGLENSLQVEQARCSEFEGALTAEVARCQEVTNTVQSEEDRYSDLLATFQAERSLCVEYKDALATTAARCNELEVELREAERLLVAQARLKDDPQSDKLNDLKAKCLELEGLLTKEQSERAKEGEKLVMEIERLSSELDKWVFQVREEPTVPAKVLFKEAPVVMRNHMVAKTNHQESVATSASSLAVHSKTVRQVPAVIPSTVSSSPPITREQSVVIPNQEGLKLGQPITLGGLTSPRAASPVRERQAASPPRARLATSLPSASLSSAKAGSHTSPDQLIGSRNGSMVVPLQRTTALVQPSPKPAPAARVLGSTVTR
jgi:hypothetical protein